MNDWKVYCYTGENNKKYVGITCNSLYFRAGKNGIKYVNDGFAFGKAIEKYGFNYFTSEILENGLTFEEAKEKEKYYIQLYDTYKNGYNETYGGEGAITTNRQLVYDLWCAGNNMQKIHEITGYGETAIRNALNAFGTIAEERIQRSSGEYLQKSISQYDLNGKYIATYKSLSDAERATGVPHSNITHCLQGERQSAGGFQWSTEQLETIAPRGVKRGFHKELYQYTLDNQLVKVYPSVAEASRQTGYQKEYLAKKASARAKAYGFIWSYSSIQHS